MTFDEQIAVLRLAIATADALVQSITFDVSGINGQGGNGGLISNETIRRSDELRQMLAKAKKVLP